jgi:hypothetical protein
MKPTYTVTLGHWHSDVFGPRVSIVHEGKTIITRGSEAEARQVAEDNGWIVERVGDEMLTAASTGAAHAGGEGSA